MQRMEILKRRVLPVMTYLVAALIIVNAILIIYLRISLADGVARAEDDEIVRRQLSQLKADAANAEIHARNYMILRSGSARTDYAAAVQQFTENGDSLQQYLLKRDEKTPFLPVLQSALAKSVQRHKDFDQFMTTADSSTLAADGWASLPNTMGSIGDVLGRLDRSADWRDYLNKVNWIGWLQLAIVPGIAVLLLLVRHSRRTAEKLYRLNRDIEDNNRKYVFDSGEEVDYDDEEGIRNRLLENLKKAANFIQQITSGNYDVRWGGIDSRNREANQHNIAGELIRMREQMKKVKEQDQQRIWATEGLTRFGEIIRRNQDKFESLADEFIAEVVKYIDAQIGGLFILEENDEGEKHLELRACYAYDRKKYLEKRIEIGEGLIGQTYLEALTTHLDKIPDEYLNITSALGAVPPSQLILVPLKTNERVEGVLELASLQAFQPHHIEFLEKIAGTLASSVIAVRTAEKTRNLLQVSQQQSEEMRAQEEEMRQNMEELEATQEQMSRQVAELHDLKESLEEEKNLFGALMDNIPDAIYFKDKNSRFIRVSKYLADHFGKDVDDLIGKSDFDFQDDVHAKEAMEDEQLIMRTRRPKIDYIEKEVLADGSVHYVSTTKMPLANKSNEVVGTFGISRDVSHIKKLEEEVHEREQLLQVEERRYQDKIAQLEEALRQAEAELFRLSDGTGNR